MSTEITYIKITDLDDVFPGDVATFRCVDSPTKVTGRVLTHTAGATLGSVLLELGDEQFRILLSDPKWGFVSAGRKKDATPARLDPKSVHVGDTVTVRFKETGDVLTTKAYQPDDITAADEYVYLLGWPLHRANGTFGLAVSHFEILAIEPAPKPEWKTRTVWVDERGTRYLAGTHGESPRLYGDDGAMVRPPMGGLRPLVVIDPAAVDVDALICAVEDSPQVQGWRHVVISLLAELGIEATP